MLTILPGGYQLLVVTDLKEQHTLLNRLLQTVLAAIGIIFALALAGGIVMNRHVQHRINAVGQTANDIISGDLSQRMPVTGRNDEFDSLSRVLNTMLARIEQLMQSMREVTDNLAHDLRNPLNRLRNRLEASQYHPSDTNRLPATDPRHDSGSGRTDQDLQRPAQHCASGIQRTTPGLGGSRSCAP